nr:MAG TPA: hypothetical protein [Caudoviricetes sp.]
MVKLNFLTKLSRVMRKSLIADTGFQKLKKSLKTDKR